MEIGLHHGSVLSPYMFLLLMDVLTDAVRKDVPGSMMFADEIVLCDRVLGDLEEGIRGERDEDLQTKNHFMDFNFGQDNGQGSEPVG